MGKVRIVETATVKPAGDTTQEGGYHLNSLDLVPRAYNKTVHWYKAPAPANFHTLRESLSRLLTHFRPVSGRLRRTAGGGLEVDCNGEGAVLVEAECDEDLETELEGATTEKLKLLVPEIEFVPERAEELPLMLAQLTRFRCGGVALGIAMCFVLTDGLSAFHLFYEWSRLARGEPLKEAPYLDRRVILSCARQGQRRDPSFSDHLEFTPPPLLLGKQDGSEERSKEIVKVQLTVTEAQLQELKAIANPPEFNDGASRPYSRYEVVTAHMWRCACKARGHKEEQPTKLYIGFNMRNRVKKAPIPPRYFGNAVFMLNVISTAGELISNPLGFACSKIREAIEKADEDYIWSYIELLDEKKDMSFYDLNKSSTTSKDALYYGNPNLRATSWLTLPLYDMDFGWGKAFNISPIQRDLDGSSYLVPKPDGDGSVELNLCLQVAHVDGFNKYFYDDMPLSSLG